MASGSSENTSVIALKNAVRNGDKELVVKLLDQGVDPNQFGNHAINATTPLMVACVNGHLDLIRLLISRGAKVNLQNGRHESALSIVPSSDIMEQSVMLEVAKILLEQKAKVHFRNDYERSAMMAACKKGYVELVRLMLPHDSWDDPEYADQVFSAAADTLHVKVVKLLLSSEHIDIDHKTLVYYLHQISGKAYRPEMASIILDKNPELVDYTSEIFSDGYTALMRASEQGYIEIVKMLLERGAKIDYQYQLDSPPEVAGFSALMVAVKSVQTETVELLLEKGAAVDLADKTGRTALIIACQNGQAELSKMLIAKGANVNHLDRRGGYVLLYAAEFAMEEFCYRSINPKTLSHFRDHCQLIETLLERGVKTDIVSNNKKTAQKLLQENALTFLRLIESKNLKYPKLMAILRPTEHEMDLRTTPLPPQTHSLLTVEDKDPESEKMSRKRDRSSSIELSEERAPKTFREDEDIPGMNVAESTNDEVISEASKDDSSYSKESSISDHPSSSKRSFPETVSYHPTETKASVSKKSDQPYTERKFNLVLYRVKESPEGTPYHVWAEKDLEAAVEILHKILPSVSNDSIHDCVRIGKYSPKKTRPLLVSFLRARDVRLILQRLSPEVLPSGIAIKPHMSATEMKVESILLGERWKNVQVGMEKSKIKIRGTKLFIDSHLVGEVVDGVYKPVNTSISS